MEDLRRFAHDLFAVGLFPPSLWGNNQKRTSRLRYQSLRYAVGFVTTYSGRKEMLKFGAACVAGKGIYKEERKEEYRWPEHVPFRSLNNTPKPGGAMCAKKDCALSCSFCWGIQEVEAMSHDCITPPHLFVFQMRLVRTRLTWWRFRIF